MAVAGALFELGNEHKYRIVKMESQPWEQYAHSQALSNAGKKDLIWGFIVLGIGAGITLGTWTAAAPGGSYWVMWGLIVGGLVGVFRGLYRKVKSGSVLGTRGRWIIASISVIGCLTWGGIFTYQYMYTVPPTPPSDSYIVENDSSYWQNEVLGILCVNGYIDNTHHEWTIKEVKIVVEALDEHGKVMLRYMVPVTPSTIPPHGRGIYSQYLSLPYGCVEAAPSIQWTWVPP
jgi:hypothetical protein